MKINHKMKVRKSIQTIGPEKPLLVSDHETKDDSKSSGVDTPTIDGSIVGSPGSKEGDMRCKVTTGDKRFETPQKDAHVEKNTPNAKKSGGSGTKRLITEILQDGKESTPTPKRSKRKTNKLEIYSPKKK